jgi:hypothetical protein
MAASQKGREAGHLIDAFGCLGLSASVCSIFPRSDPGFHVLLSSGRRIGVEVVEAGSGEVHACRGSGADEYWLLVIASSGHCEPVLRDGFDRALRYAPCEGICVDLVGEMS